MHSFIRGLTSVITMIITTSETQDSIKTLAQWRKQDSLPPQHPELLDGLIGKIVLWPGHFLSEENLASKRTEKEHYMPTRIVQ